MRTGQPDKQQPEKNTKPDKQKFTGFQNSNLVIVLSEVTDRLMAQLCDSEFKVLHYIIRRTLGFHKPYDAISLSQFINGIQKHNGNRLDYGTGLSKPSVLKGIAGLVEKGIIWAERRTEPHSRHEINVYGLCFANSNIHLVNIDAYSEDNYSPNEYTKGFAKSLHNTEVVKNIDQPDSKIVNYFNRKSSKNNLPVIKNCEKPEVNAGKVSLLPSAESPDNFDTGVVNNFSRPGTQPVKKFDRHEESHAKQKLESNNMLLSSANLAVDVSAAEISPKPFNNSLVERLTQFGFDPATIQNLTNQYKESYLLEKIKFTLEKQKQETLTNPPGFLLKALENNYRSSFPSSNQGQVSVFPAVTALLSRQKNEKSGTEQDADILQEVKSIDRSNAIDDISPRDTIKDIAQEVIVTSQNPKGPLQNNSHPLEELHKSVIEELRGPLHRPDLAQTLQKATLKRIYEDNQACIEIILPGKWLVTSITISDMGILRLAFRRCTGYRCDLKLLSI